MAFNSVRIMKKKLFLSVFLMLVFSMQKTEAQSIVRSTFCGAGATWSSSVGTLTSTFGQCPGCGTLTSSSVGTVTPGFQQPSGNDTCFLVSFDYEATITNCGTLFDFIYTGNADITAVTFEWDFGDSGFPATSNMVNPQGVSFSSTGLKTVVLKVSGTDCTKFFNLDIPVDAIGFSSNPIVTNVSCPYSEDGGITIEFSGGAAPYDIIWSNSQTEQTIENLPSGDYAYTVTDGLGCETANTATVAPSADSVSFEAVVVDETCEGDLDGSIELIDLLGGTPPLSLQWSDGQLGARIQNVGAGIHLLTVLDGNDCMFEFEMEIGQDCNPDIIDIVSPNGDGVNDEWVIEGIESFPDNEVFIYNRWGEVVWATVSYMNDWVGTYEDGTPLPIGAYYYVVNLNNASNVVLSGSITIIR